MPFPLPGDVKSMQLQTIRHCCRCHSISSLICVAVFVLHCADYEYNYFTQIRRICIFCIGHSGQPLKCTTTQKCSKWCSNIKTNNLKCCWWWCRRLSKQLSDIFSVTAASAKKASVSVLLGEQRRLTNMKQQPMSWYWFTRWYINSTKHWHNTLSNRAWSFAIIHWVVI